MFRPWETIEAVDVQKNDHQGNDREFNGNGINGNLQEEHSFFEHSNPYRYPGYMNIENDSFKTQAAKVIFDFETKQSILKKIHEGLPDSLEAILLSSHRDKYETIQHLTEKYYWSSMIRDTILFIEECKVCQRVNPVTFKSPKMVFKRIGIDFITMPEDGGFRFVVVAFDYFSKWCEARPIQNKKATTVARFIYDEIICRHGCPKIEISNQRQDFRKHLRLELFKMMGTTIKITSPYHPRVSGIVERFNRTIKNTLLKIHNESVLKWPDVLQGVLFAYRSAPHTSTRYSPFFALYQREAVLPLNATYYDAQEDRVNEMITDDFDDNIFQERLKSMLLTRIIPQDNSKKNIKATQELQTTSYVKRRLRSDTNFNEVDDDAGIIATEQQERYYYPVGKQWQQEKCRLLNLKLYRFFKTVDNCKALGNPIRRKRIGADGNCLYRALCFWITGSEDDHSIIRQRVYKIVKTNEIISNYVGGEENLRIYLKTNPIDNDYIWGTDTEIYGAAILLDTSIYVFSTQTNAWQFFSKNVTFSQPQKKERYIYLININNMHYEVVTDVDTANGVDSDNLECN